MNPTSMKFICHYCNEEIKRSKVWDDFNCQKCGVVFHIALASQEVSCISFDAQYNGKGFQIYYFPEKDETRIVPFLTIDNNGDAEISRPIILPGKVISPQNAQIRLATILLFH